MAETTSTYRLYNLSDGDVFFAGYDRRNMRTLDNQISELFAFVGPGVVDGWLVIPMPAMGSGDDAATMAERQALAGAADGSYLSREYARIGRPGVNDEVAWAQTVRVTAGSGAVGIYPAATVYDAYFRFTSAGVYYVWADAGPCLVTEGRVSISAPLDDDYDRDARVVCTYLATVEVAMTVPPAAATITQGYLGGSAVMSGYSLPPVAYVSDVLYEGKRNALKDLAGAVQRALAEAFLNHRHTGEPGEPSKILLSTQVVLSCVGPVGSTILLTQLEGAAFAWSAADYGVPTVRYDNVALPSDAYTLQPGSGRVMLKNSPPAGVSVTVVLPLSAQVSLSMHPSSLVTDAMSNPPPRNLPIFLTDGVMVPVGGSGGDDDDGAAQTEPRVFTWDAGVYRPPQVFIDGAEAPASLYALYPERGAVDFEPPLAGGTVAVLLTHIGDQVQGKLSGKRVANLDASSFVRGTLDPTRLYGLSHVGLNRFMETASVRPPFRALSEGDHSTFYPETDQALQLGADVRSVSPATGVAGFTHLVGTKHGLAGLASSNLAASGWVAGWPADQGMVAHAVQETMEAEPGVDWFHTVWALADLGDGRPRKVYFSRDGGVAWKPLRLPIVGNRVVSPTCFHATTDRAMDNSSLFLIKYDYSTLLYLGTEEDGLWTATIADGAGDDDWSWNQADYVTGRVNALQVITTRYYSVTVSEGVSVITENYARTVYLGTPDGFYVGSARYSDDPVRGFHWAREADRIENALVWWSDDAVWISPTAVYHEDRPDDSTDTTYWDHPLQGPRPRTLAARVSTDADATLSGLGVVDGAQLADGDRVLVRAQGAAQDNGLYVAHAGAWARTADDLSVADAWVDVAQGSVRGGSRWANSFAGTGPFVVGASPMAWTDVWWRPILDAGQGFSDAVGRPGTLDHYVLAEGGAVWALSVAYASLDDAHPEAVGARSLAWDPKQGEPRWGFTAPNSLGGEATLVVAGSRGLWQSLDAAASWSRCDQEFSGFAEPRLFDERTGERLAPAEYVVDFAAQAFVFGGARPAWESYLYERDFQRYFVAPWNQSGADEVVYVNGQPSAVAYSLFPDEGRIQFSASLSPDDGVQITIVRAGAFIADVGTVPHMELPNVVVVGNDPLTTLADDFNAGDGELVLVDRTKVPAAASYLEVRDGTFAEREAVAVDATTLRVFLTRPRSGDHVYPKGSEVRLVSIERVLGLEDEASLAQGGLTYHMGSLFLDNVLRYALQRKSADPSLFGRWGSAPLAGTTADRGMKGVRFFDDPSLIDPEHTAAFASAGLTPVAPDLPDDPQEVTALDMDADGGQVGTEDGVWSLSGGAWRQDSALDGATSVYFLQGALLGSDKGVYRRADGGWSADPTYPQPTFCHLSFSWDKGTAEAWGKADGLAMVWQPPAGSDGTTPPFQSDHFDLVDGKRVYGLWSGQFYRLSEDAQGNVTQTPVDGLYLATELGLFGVTDGNLNRSGQTAAFLGGREMFGQYRPTMEVALPGGGTTVAPVKFYRIFQAEPRPACGGGDTTPTVPLILLSNNGVYRVRNWRWCDPNDKASLDFYPEVHALDGISCYCYATDTRPCSTGVEPLSKAFVGTDRGVFRSFDEGTTWERCERIGDDSLVVHDLQRLAEGTILAATERGLFLTTDDGDTWSRPSYPYEITNASSFAAGPLAMTFQPKAAGALQSDLRRAELWLSTFVPEGHPNPTACLANTLSVRVCEVDPATGLPGAPLAGVATVTAGAVGAPGFVSFDLAVGLGAVVEGSRFAIVATEAFAAGSNSTSVFRWHPSARSDPYPQGQACAYSGSWAAIQGVDFFFRASFQADPDPYEETVSVPFDEGERRGLVVTDAGALTMDTKAVMVLVVDDSASAWWSDPTQGARAQELPKMFSSVFARTQSGAFQPSHGGVWGFGTTTSDRTDGLTSDLTTLSLRATALFSRGVQSQPVDAAHLAATEVNPQGVVDAYFADDGWGARVQALVDDLSAKGLLRLDELRAWFTAQPAATRSLWPAAAADAAAAGAVASYEDVARHLVGRWAASASPLLAVVADGEDGSTATAEDVVEALATTWDDAGIGAFVLGLGRASAQPTLRAIAGGPQARFVDVATLDDWDSAIQSLLHGGANSLFGGAWSYDCDFASPTWVASVSASYAAPGGSSCLVEARWSPDRVTFSAWTAVPSGTAVQVDGEMLDLQFRVSMEEGWNGAARETPSVSSLTYDAVRAGTRTVVTLPQDSDGALAEYLLTSIGAVERDARVDWYVVRGDSVDMDYAEPIHVNRRGVLSDRQLGIQYTKALVRQGLATTSADQTVFQVVDANSQPTNWLPTDQVRVFEGVYEVAANAGYYSVDPALGKVYFGTAQPVGLPVTVTITTPPKLVRTVGEATTTADGRTFYLSGGPFPPDATVVVVRNGTAMRGGYRTSPASGTVTLAVEAEATDVITVYVQHASVFRVIAQVSRYGASDPDLSTFALATTSRKNGDLAFEVANGAVPQIAAGTLRVDPPSATVDDRIVVDYDYVSADGARERDTRTEWWRWRTGYVPAQGDSVDADGFVRIASYDDRTVMREVDRGALFDQGDRLYVAATPSDGFSLGDRVDSRPSVTLLGTHAPYVVGLALQSDGLYDHGGLTFVKPGSDVLATYSFTDLDGGADQSSVVWRERDSQVAYHTGRALPASLVVAGKALAWTVTPYDGESYGRAVDGPGFTVG